MLYYILLYRRALGLITPMFNVDGRIHLAEAERFINEVIQVGRKLVIPFRLYTSNPPPAAYTAFCNEYTKDGRVGACNINKVATVYLIPPGIKTSLTFLKDFEIAHDVGRALYGIIVSKETGPVEITSGQVEPFDLEAPLEPTAEKAKAASSSSSSAASPRLNLVSVQAAMSSTSASIPVTVPQPATIAQTPPPPPPPVFKVPAPLPPPPSPKITSSVPFAPTSVPTTAPPAPAPPVASQAVAPAAGPNVDIMKKTAEFCVNKGPATLDNMRSRPDASARVPFLFEGNEGYERFMNHIASLTKPNEPLPFPGFPPL